jgi:hypothetical protein
VLNRGSVGRSKIIVFGTRETIETAMVVSATPIKWMRVG